MRTSFTVPIEYFLSEGRAHLKSCLTAAFEAALQHEISKIIVFTARGEGLRLALDEFCSQPNYQHLQLVGVTFPQGKEFTDKEGKQVSVTISDADEEVFRKANVRIIRAHLPFDPITPTFRSNGVLGQDVSLVGEVLSIFGGSMSLCVQAALMACDAGEVKFGDHAIALTSDTAIIARVSPTHSLLRDFIVREIICKPAILTIGKGEKALSLEDDPPSDTQKELSAPA